jgi:TetR/AcrR family transcriptional regulator, transcriptional repressor for nem operon
MNAAFRVVLSKGYSAATVDDICREAGLTKGSFFHHFKTKDDLALGAAAHWSFVTEAFFAAAEYRTLADPLDRLLGYIDLRTEILRGELPDYTCFLGTLLHETYRTHPEIRAACETGLSNHIANLACDAEEAKQLYAPRADWSAESVGVLIQSVLQGAFNFAKAKQRPEAARECLSHVRRYVALLFNAPKGAKPEETQ